MTTDSLKVIIEKECDVPYKQYCGNVTLSIDEMMNMSNQHELFNTLCKTVSEQTDLVTQAKIIKHNTWDITFYVQAFNYYSIKENNSTDLNETTFTAEF